MDRRQSSALENAPQRIGRALSDELTGIHSARLGKNSRVLDETDDHQHEVIVLDSRHRATAYRPR